LFSPGLRRQTEPAGRDRAATSRPRHRRYRHPTWDGVHRRSGGVEECRSAPASAAFVTSVEFRDGAIVHAGDLLYVIDSRPVRAVALQADASFPTREPRPNWPSAELDRALTCPDSRLPNPSSTTPPDLAGRMRQSMQRGA